MRFGWAKLGFLSQNANPCDEKLWLSFAKPIVSACETYCFGV